MIPFVCDINNQIIDKSRHTINVDAPRRNIKEFPAPNLTSLVQFAAPTYSPVQQLVIHRFPVKTEQCINEFAKKLLFAKEERKTGRSI